MPMEIEEDPQVRFIRACRLVSLALGERDLTGEGGPSGTMPSLREARNALTDAYRAADLLDMGVGLGDLPDSVQDVRGLTKITPNHAMVLGLYALLLLKEAGASPEKGVELTAVAAELRKRLQPAAPNERPPDDKVGDIRLK